MTETVKDAAYWARLHIASDKSKPVKLPPTTKRINKAVTCQKKFA